MFELGSPQYSKRRLMQAVSCHSPRYGMFEHLPANALHDVFPGGMQSQLNDVKRYFGADIQRMMQEFEARIMICLLRLWNREVNKRVTA